VEGSAGKVESRATDVTIEVPGLPRRTLRVTVYPFASQDPLCVGILGSDFLRGAPFQLRYAERALIWNAPAPSETVALTIDEAGIPRVSARLNERELDLRIDTGASFPPGRDAHVNVTVDQAEILELTGQAEAVFRATGTGDTPLELFVHRLRSLEIAGRKLEPAHAIVQPRVGYFARDDATGFVGNAVLDKLDPWFDYASGRFGVAR
jgi:hypothetical protein